MNPTIKKDRPGTPACAQPSTEAAVRAACNAAPESPGCLFPACDCRKLPRAVTSREALGGTRPSLPLSIGQPAAHIATMIEVDRRRGSIGICHAVSAGPGARVTGTLWLPPDEAEALAHALLLAVTDWRADQAATAWTMPAREVAR